MSRIKLLVFFFAVAVAISGMSCGHSNPDSGLKVGDQMTYTIESGGQTVYTEVQEVVEIEPARGDKPPVLVLLTKSSSGTKQGEPTNVTYEDIQNFLDSTWAAYMGGKKDEGKHAYELFQYLQKWGISFSSFRKMCQSWNGPTGGLVSLLDEVHGLNMHQGDDVWKLSNFLQSTNITAQQFQQALDNAGTTVSGFFATYGGNFHDLYRSYSRSRTKDFSAFVGSVMSGTTAANVGIDDADVEITKMVWDIIKDGKAQTEADGAYARVLNPKDDNWANYQYARNDETDTSTFKGKNFYGITIFKVELKSQCTYHASSPNYGGLYIPNVYVDPTDAYSVWPWKVNASVTISNVTNYGSTTEPNPGLTAHVQMKFNSGLQSAEDSKDYYFYGDVGCWQSPQK